jgi:8-oxo-dGTP pyrophosphatase MutT (NUDIX family)
VSDSPREAGAIRRAATVMLVRDVPPGIEVLLLRRSATSAFAADAFVFPGGALDDADDDSLERAAVRELFEEAHVRLFTAALVRFSHWITPPGEARRFDTFFFVARAPDDQVARADEREMHDLRWIAPSDALAQHGSGTLHLVYPTIKHLERLAPFTDVDALLAYARTKKIVTVAPYALLVDGYAMPADLEGCW